MGKMFDFNPTDYADLFAQQRYVHIVRGLTDDFLVQMKSQVEEYLRGPLLEDYAVGDKEQALYELPQDDDYLQDLLAGVAGVCGLEAGKLILSERHIKTYNADADPRPLAHKDRFASEITVGLPVHVPEGSTLMLYPDDELECNPFNSSTEYRQSFTPDRAPELALEHARRVEVPACPGDVVIFLGNRIWHTRWNAAGTASLFLKLNTYHSDPLGEDPRHPDLRKRSDAALELADGELDDWVPVLGSRVDYLGRRYDRLWNETIVAALYRRPALRIDADEMAAIQRMDGRTTVGDLVRGDRPLATASIRRLAAAGVLDLLPPVSVEAAPETATLAEESCFGSPEEAVT